MRKQRKRKTENYVNFKNI